MARQYILSIDQGTTGTTVSLISTKGLVKSKINREFRQIFPKPGWVEHDPKDIWNSTRRCIADIFKQSSVSPTQLVTIGITNQRETVVGWDRETGETIGNAIVWQCRRTTDICKKLKAQGAEKKLQQITGLVLDPYFSGTKIHWFLKNNSKAKKLAIQGRLCFGTIDAFLIWKLTGGQSFKTDVSNASRTQLMDLSKLQYSSDMLKLFSVQEQMLPEICGSGDHFGETVRVAGLPSGIPIRGVLGDQQSALFGQQCFARGDAKITFGTGSFLLMNTKERKIVSKNGLLTTVAWHQPGQKRPDYALEGGAFICGAAVQWLRDNMKFIKNSKDIEKLASRVDDAQGVQFIPALSGLGAPFWDANVRGTLWGLTRGTSKENIAYATLEAMALQNVDVVQTMTKDSGLKLRTVRVDGGASANNKLMQMQADFLGVRVIRPRNVETTSLGVALMAGLGAGVWASVDELKSLDKVDAEFTCQWPLPKRKARLSQWHRAIAAMQTYYSPYR